MTQPQRPSGAVLSERDLFVFAHIPKTAGMTFKDLLDRQFTPDRVLRIGPDYQGSIDHVKALSEADKARILCLSGHLPYGVHRYFERRTPHYVSFVRHPIDRAMSEYFFFASRPKLKPLIGLGVNDKLSPEAFLEHQASVGMLDFQARVLSGFDNMVESVMPPYEKLPLDQADSLIKEITDSFDFIGTVERFDESLLLMREQFGWRSVHYVRRNVTPKSEERIRLRQALAEEIQRLNPIDCRLYAHVGETIDARISENGELFAQELGRFRSRNRWYSRGWNVYRATGLRRLRKTFQKIRPGGR